MLKRLLRKLKALFGKPKPSKPSVGYGDMVGNVKIERPYQLDKHTAFKPGESYKLGEATVTVHANKESMLRAIAAVNARREARHAALTEKAIKIMLMTPDELKQFQLDQWMEQRGKAHSIIRGIVGVFAGKRYVRPEELPPGGSPKERFQQAMQGVKENTKG